MTYKALTRFADLNDGNRIYEAGETYPRLGLDVTPERIAELAGSDNRMGYPLIAADVQKTPKETRKPEEWVVIDEPPKNAQRGRRSRQRG